MSKEIELYVAQKELFDKEYDLNVTETPKIVTLSKAKFNATSGEFEDVQIKNLAYKKKELDDLMAATSVASFPSEFIEVKTISYEAGIPFILLTGLESIHDGIMRITFSSSGKGGNIYDATILLNYARNILTNGSNEYDVPFSLSAHALNGRSIRLFRKESSRSDEDLANSLYMEISENAESVEFTIESKRIF